MWKTILNTLVNIWVATGKLNPVYFFSEKTGEDYLGNKISQTIFKLGFSIFEKYWTSWSHCMKDVFSLICNLKGKVKMDLKLNILFIFSGWKYWWACRRPLDGSWEVQPSKAEEHGWDVTLQDDEDWLRHLDCRICSHSQWPISCSSCNWNDCWPLWWCHQAAWVGRLCEKISWSSGRNSWKTC